MGGVGAGLPVLAVREMAAGRATREVVGRLVLTQMCATSIVAVGAGVSGIVLLGSPQGLIQGLLAGCFYVAMSVMTLGSALQAGRRRYGHAIFGESITGIACAALTVFGLELGWGLSGALAGLVIGAAIGSVVLWVNLSPSFPRDGLRAWQMLRESAPFLALGLLNAGYLRIDIVILGIVATPHAVGVYSAAYRLLGPFTLLMSGFGTVFFSRLSAGGGTSAQWHAIRRRGRLLLFVSMLPLVLAAFAAAPWLINWIYGPAFSAAGVPARILICSILPIAWYWPSAHALNAAGRERTWTLLLARLMIIDALLVAVLGHLLAATGAAVAWLLAESLLLVPVSREAARLEAPADTAANYGNLP